MDALLVHAVSVVTRQPLTLAMTTSAQLGVPIGAAALGKTTGVLAGGEAIALLLGARITIGVVTALSGRLVRPIGPDGSATPWRSRRGPM